MPGLLVLLFIWYAFFTFVFVSMSVYWDLTLLNVQAKVVIIQSQLKLFNENSFNEKAESLYLLIWEPVNIQFCVLFLARMDEKLSW